MLKKLIKYDLISNIKFISIFYILGTIFAIFTRIFFSIDDSLIASILGQITTGATISMLVSILINNLMRFWVRFKNTIYDDESYLTHTLPLNKKTIYLSKFITSLIVMLLSFIVSIIILFIAYYSKENIELLKTTLLPIINILDISIIKILLIFVFILFLELFSALLCGYLGIIIGHMFNNKRLLKSVIFGFLSYIITQLIVLLILFIIALFNDNIMNLFYSNVINDISIIKTITYISVFSYSLLIILNMIISIKLFNEGVNVE